MIVTCKKQVPLHWIIFAILPWAAVIFSTQVMGTAFLFSLKKFVENPAGLTFIMSLPSLIALVSGPVSSFLSDRIWTPYGRRKPFIVVSWTGIVLSLVLMPLMPTLWSLIAMYMVYNLFSNIGSPSDALQQEIVPPQQRGRATAGMQWCSNFASVLFYFVALGRFDDVQFVAGFPVFGEEAIYWSAGLLIAVMLLLVALGIKEMEANSSTPARGMTVAGIFGSIFNRELWPVYSLAFAAAMLGSGLGALSNLLYTDQWGYSKQDMGTNVAVGGTLNLCLIVLLGIIADRLPRLRAYQLLVMIAMALKVSFYCYVEFLLPDKRPSLCEVILFGESMAVVSILTSMVYTPLVYDYVPRNEMGTFGAGASIVTRLTQLLTLNGVGLFVWAFATLFQPPAGETVTVAMRDEMRRPEMNALIRQASWNYPPNGQPAPVSAMEADPWYATGLVTDVGRGWEIRLRDKDSELLDGRKAQLDQERSKTISQEQLAKDQAVKLARENKKTEAAAQSRKATDLDSQVAGISAKIGAIEAQLAKRSENLRSQVAGAFGNRIMADGDQVLGARVNEALVLDLPVSARPMAAGLEKALKSIRGENPHVIDLRPIRRGTDYGLAASAIIQPGENDTDLSGTLQEEVRRAVDRYQPGLLSKGMSPLDVSRQPALAMDLLTLEDPLDKWVSPVTRITNWVTALFGNVSGPDRRLAAVGHSLHVAGQTGHVRIGVGPQPKSISVQVIFDKDATKAGSANDALGVRLRSLIGDNSELFQALAFYDRLLDAAALQRITIARPFISNSYARMRYDYMSGYIWMFLLSAIGLLINFLFGRREKKGLIRKRGVEEARQTEDVASVTISEVSAFPSPAPDYEDLPVAVPGSYIPGHSRRKMLMVVFGLVILGFGITQAWTPLRLLFFGGKALAEATCVTKSIAGLPPVVLTNDLAVQAATETMDRSYVFTNEFSYRFSDGRDITVSSPVRSQLKPLYPLLDDDGLPTSVPIRYDKHEPEKVIFPMAFSTWFIPGMLIFCGLGCAIIGAVLLYWADKPIEKPHIKPVFTRT